MTSKSSGEKFQDTPIHLPILTMIEPKPLALALKRLSPAQEQFFFIYLVQSYC